MKQFSIQFREYHTTYSGQEHVYIVQAETKEEAARTLAVSLPGIPSAYLLERGTIEEVVFVNGIAAVGTVFFDG